jgi:hypothetical protein
MNRGVNEMSKPQSGSKRSKLPHSKKLLFIESFPPASGRWPPAILMAFLHLHASIALAWSVYGAFVPWNLGLEGCGPVGQQRERGVQRTLFYAGHHETPTIREYGVGCFKS